MRPVLSISNPPKNHPSLKTHDRLEQSMRNRNRFIVAIVAAVLAFVVFFQTLAPTANAQALPAPKNPGECISGISYQETVSGATDCVPEYDFSDFNVAEGTEITLYGDFGQDTDNIGVAELLDATGIPQAKLTEAVNPTVIVGKKSCQVDFIVSGKDMPATFNKGGLQAEEVLGTKPSGFFGFGVIKCGGVITTTTTAPATTTTTTTTTTTAPTTTTTAPTTSTVPTTTQATTTSTAPTTTKPEIPPAVNSGSGASLLPGVNRSSQIILAAIFAMAVFGMFYGVSSIWTRR